MALPRQTDHPSLFCGASRWATTLNLVGQQLAHANHNSSFFSGGFPARLIRNVLDLKKTKTIPKKKVLFGRYHVLETPVSRFRPIWLLMDTHWKEARDIPG